MHPSLARGSSPGFFPTPVSKEIKFSRYNHRMEIDFRNGKKLRLLIGDITKIRVDAIVNAANSSLAGGGGVDGAIHRAGGPVIMRELDGIRVASGGCPTGSAVVTTAGALPAQYVFHAVGPIYRDGRHGEAAQLASCYRKCLELAEERDVRTISFPAISTGAYGYPAKEAAGIALETVANHLALEQSNVREVFFVLFDQGFYQLHQHAARHSLANWIK
jgi:O-acetyl-ADP-ribose deacetylase (regulator of RNase III)